MFVLKNKLNYLFLERDFVILALEYFNSERKPFQNDFQKKRIRNEKLTKIIRDADIQLQ